jgi:hypothetical protein
LKYSQDTLVDQKIGMLLVVEQLPSTKKERLWKCICECGNIITRKTSHLLDSGLKCCKACQYKYSHKPDVRSNYSINDRKDMKKPELNLKTSKVLADLKEPKDTTLIIDTTNLEIIFNRFFSQWQALLTVTTETAEKILLLAFSTSAQQTSDIFVQIVTLLENISDK